MRAGLLLSIVLLMCACSSEDFEHRGFAAWADDESAMAIVTQRILVRRQAFRTEGDVEGMWYRLWVRDANDGALRLILDEREGGPRDVYLMNGRGYALIDLNSKAVLVSLDGERVDTIEPMEGERDFVPSRDGSIIASARLRDCVGDWPSECQASVVFRDVATLEIIEETDSKPVTPATRDSVLWTRDHSAVLTDGTVAYHAVPGDGDTRLPAIEVPCLWAPTSSFYIDSDGMFIEVDVEDERPVVTLRSSDDPTASCPVP